MPAVTVPEAFALALQHHQAGRLEQAEALFQQILTLQPHHAGALHHLGLVAHQRGRHDLASQWIRHSLTLAPENSAAHSNLGEVLRSLGRLDEAVASLRRALELKPDSAQACYNLGNVLREQGELDQAITVYRQALRFDLQNADAFNNLGIALAELGKLDEAVSAYGTALRLQPRFSDAHNNLGIALARQGHFDAALAAHERALEIEPDSAEGTVNLANVLRESGRLDQAEAAGRRAIALQPGFAEAHDSLGIVFTRQGRLAEAVAAYRRALELRPSYAEAHGNLGFALAQQGRLDEAIAAHQRSLELKPGNAEVYVNIGNALRERGRPDEAIDSYLRALQLRPDLPNAHLNLGNALKDQGRIEEAVAAYRHELQLQPGHATARSNLVYTLHFHPGYDAEMIAGEQRQWNQQFAASPVPSTRSYSHDRDPDRRLRIGYVSPEFRDHVTGRYLAPLLARHDRAKVEILCYSGVVRPDRRTEEFRRRADHWRNIAGVADGPLAEMIRSDRVDILVDLTQHLAGNRLSVFARQPAPVQVSFAGYPESTGVEAIRFRISDRYLEKKVTSTALEQVFLLDSFWCYDPCGLEVKVNESPAAQNKRVTFGCMNNFCKVNETVQKLWARVLGKIEDSRLLLLCPPGFHRRRAMEVFAQAGVAAGRVEFAEPRPRKAYLELYRELDIALDTFPYNGHTTSLDAFWMGVPVVSLAGEQAVSRAGYSQLSNLGLSELAAFSQDDFVRIATELAGDLPRLSQLRRTLRARMETSTLMDAARFTRGIEDAYRTTWRAWCGEVRMADVSEA